jgi:hypothetical protein
VDGGHTSQRRKRGWHLKVGNTSWME